MTTEGRWLALAHSSLKIRRKKKHQEGEGTNGLYVRGIHARKNLGGLAQLARHSFSLLSRVDPCLTKAFWMVISQGSQQTAGSNTLFHPQSSSHFVHRPLSLSPGQHPERKKSGLNIIALLRIPPFYKMKLPRGNNSNPLDYFRGL